METKYDALPDALQDALFDDEIANKMYEIGKKYSLSKDSGKIASAEAGNIILGLTKPQEFSARISERIGLKTAIADTLANDIYISVLKPLAGEIKRVHGFELNENVFGAKPPSPVAPQAEPQKPSPLVILPRPIEQKPPSPLRPVPPPPRTPEPTMQSTPSLPTPLNPLNIPRQAPVSPPPAPPPALPPEQTEPRPPSIARAPLAPPMPPRPNAPRESMIAPPLPKPQTPPRTQAPRSIFSPQTPGPLQPPPPLEPPRKDLTSARQAQSSEPRVFAPKHSTSPRDLDDPYRETVTQQEKELQQKRDQVSNPRAPEPPFQVRKGEPPYVNPKIPPIDLREDATRPPKPPDPHWEKLQ